MKNLIEAAVDAGNFKTLLSAFRSASLIDMLRSPGQYTIFAPTDAAFKRLPAGSLDALFKDARSLKPFLCNHMMTGVKAANDILPGELKPMEGRPLRASMHGSAILINKATIVQSDIRATNGVIHAIDDVLVPLNPILAAVA
ncbi:MAG TPA: fasciclin domain-containing protein [Steroidobacteraceae bacterium]|nr:fasciclin domain-containing protein [Steroidobacteraceae bacterium]